MNDRPVPIPPENDRLCWAVPLSVALLTFAVFLPALKGGFVNWDDFQNLVENQKYRGLGWEQLKWMFTTFLGGPYQPLSWVTYGLDYHIWGMDPLGYHLTNIILHSVNAAVFCLLCIKLLGAAEVPLNKVRRSDLYLSAAFAALFFAIHPLRVESVAWATERRDLLSGLFYLLTILWYMSSRSAGWKKISCWRRHILPSAGFLLSLLSKGMGISLPIVLIVLDIYPLRRLPANPRLWFSLGSRNIWLEKIPFILLAAVFGAIGYAGQTAASAVISYQQYSLAAHSAEALYGVVFYIWKTIIPLDLSPIYRLPGGFGLISRLSLFAGVVIAVITATAVVMRRRWPAGPAIWGYYLIVLSPILAIIRTIADRYTYLPCLGFAVLAGAGLHTCRQASGRLLENICSALACLIISGLVCLTWRQEKIWHDSETLWTHALASNQELDLAHYNLAYYLAEHGRFDEAVKHYREAVRIDPGYAQAQVNLGAALAAQGKLEEAAGYWLQALRIDPNFTEARNGLGAALAAQGRLDEAIQQWLEALKIDPGFAPAHNNIGAVLDRQGKFEEAMQHYRAALKINPDYGKARYNLGLDLAEHGDPGQAAEYFREALRMDPDSASIHHSLGNALHRQGQLGQAALQYLEALRINPDYAEAHNDLGAALSAQGKQGEAVKQWREALKIDPNCAQARQNLRRSLPGQAGKGGQ